MPKLERSDWGPARHLLEGWLARMDVCVAETGSRLRTALAGTPAALRLHLERQVRGYGAAVLGIAAASLFIALVQHIVHVSNISLVYLFVVLYLAWRFGRWPAVLASLLAFLAYDLLFIPPFYRLTVDDPAQWVSLAALLVTALVLGQLTATVEERRREAVASQLRTATLYALAQLIASSRDEQSLLDVLVQRVVRDFDAVGVEACGVILPGGDGGGIELRAAAPTHGSAIGAIDLHAPERVVLVREVMGIARAAGGVTTALDGDLLREMHWLYVPLCSGEHVVGVLGIGGRAGIDRLRVEPVESPATRMPTGRRERRSGPREHEAPQDAQNEPSAQAALFAAFCDQIALALERAELRRAAIHAEALRESDKLKTALLGAVTHDLRTPLAAIKAATGSLLEPDAAWSLDDRRELLESIDASVDRLDRLVRNLLDLSRLEGGAAMPEKDWYPIGDVLATVLDQLELAGQTRHHRIEVDIPPDIPLVPMDYRLMEEVFANLLENAIKYSPIGSCIRVQAQALSVAPQSMQLEVRVADQGIGVPPSEREAIFGKFYRVQQVRLPWAKCPPAGTGLGLAICAGITRAHGGRIWVESVLGKGSTFVFTLPIPASYPHSALPEVNRPSEPSAASSPSATSGEPQAELPQREATA